MYKIIGADGKEYGPITASQLQQWIAQGRAAATTKVKRDDFPDWQTLGALPEFAQSLAQPPSLPNLPPIPPPPPQTSALAIASLIFGALGFLCITAPVGLVLGIVALVQISKSQGRLKGQGLAIGGVIASAVFLLLMPAMLLPALAKAKAKAQGIHCINNVKQINLAILIHGGDNTNTYPPATTWCDAIQPELGSTQAFQCLAGDKSQRCHYAFNTNLGGLALDQVRNPAQTVMVFETDGGWNLSGGRELLLQKPRHDRAVVIGFVDGHVEMVTKEQLSQLVWKP